MNPIIGLAMVVKMKPSCKPKRKKGAAMKILGHIILTFLTGGLWLVFLFIRYVTK